MDTAIINRTTIKSHLELAMILCCIQLHKTLAFYTELGKCNFSITECHICAANCVLHTTLHKNVFILPFTTKDPLGKVKRLGRMGNCAGKYSFHDNDNSHVRLRNGDDRGLNGDRTALSRSGRIH